MIRFLSSPRIFAVDWKGLMLAALAMATALLLSGGGASAQNPPPLGQAAPGVRSSGPAAGPALDLPERIAADIAFGFIRLLKSPGCIAPDYQVAVLNPLFEGNARANLSQLQLDRIKTIVQDAVTKAHLPLASIGEGGDVSILVGLSGATDSEARQRIAQIEGAFALMAQVEVQSAIRNRANIKIKLFDRNVQCLEVAGEYQVRVDEPWLREYAASQARLIAQLVRTQGGQLVYIPPIENYDGDQLKSGGGSCGPAFREALASFLQREHQLRISLSPSESLHLQIKVDASDGSQIVGTDGESIYATKFSLIKDGVEELISTPSTRVKAFRCNLDAIPRDSDNDGLSDKDERQLGTDPNAADSDSDGINDNDEIALFKTNPLSADSDRGGKSDKRELELGLDPMDSKDDQAGPLALSEIMVVRHPSPVRSQQDQIDIRWGEKLRFTLLNDGEQTQSALCLANDDSNETFLLSQAPMALKASDEASGGAPGQLFYPEQAAAFDFTVGQIGMTGEYEFFVQCLTHTAWSKKALDAWSQAFDQQLDDRGEPYNPQSSDVTEILLAVLRNEVGFGEMLLQVSVR